MAFHLGSAFYSAKMMVPIMRTSGMVTRNPCLKGEVTGLRVKWRMGQLSG